MERKILLLLAVGITLVSAHSLLGLSRALPRPEILYPKGYDTNRAARLQAVLESDKFRYLDGMVSYWEPDWGTTLVYEGDSRALSAFLADLNRIEGMAVRLTFSRDLSKETGSALPAGSWWVKYAHTAPDTLTVRINLAAGALGGEKLELRLPKP